MWLSEIGATVRLGFPDTPNAAVDDDKKMAVAARPYIQFGALESGPDPVRFRAVKKICA